MASLYDAYRILSGEERDALSDGNSLDDDGTMDDDAFSRHHRHHINATSITSTVIIRVTPRDDYIISWMILWAAFFFASVLAALQVYKEQRIMRVRAAEDIEHGGAEAVSSADRTRCTVCRLVHPGSSTEKDAMSHHGNLFFLQFFHLGPVPTIVAAGHGDPINFHAHYDLVEPLVATICGRHAA